MNPKSGAIGDADSRESLTGGPSGWRSARDVFAIDEVDAVVALSQTAAGRLAIYLIGLAAVMPTNGWRGSLLVVTAAMASALLPAWRNRILLAATWTVALFELVFDRNAIRGDIAVFLPQEHLGWLSTLALALGAYLIFIACVWIGLQAVRRNRTSFGARHPVLTLLGIEAALLCMVSLDLPHGPWRAVLWSVLIVYSIYIWFLAYAIVDQRSQKPASRTFQFAVLHPFWIASTTIPYGKGAAFLRKALPKTPRDLAVTQIKGVKLLVWANVLWAISLLLTWVLEGRLNIPTVDMAINAYLRHQAFPILVGWAAVIWSTAKFMLMAARWGHVFIGVARLAGFRLPRSVWRPLESRTLMDYFNRFYYYFKELLVDFFFIPTFFAVFRDRPRLRMFFATFMAAGIGNAIWHFLKDIQVVAPMGLTGAFMSYTSYFFYCVVLATGLGISQIRAQMGIKPSPGFLGRLYSFAFVWSFVVCLHVFSDESRNHTLVERLSFMASLFGAG